LLRIFIVFFWTISLETGTVTSFLRMECGGVKRFLRFSGKNQHESAPNFFQRWKF